MGSPVATARRKSGLGIATALGLAVLATGTGVSIAGSAMAQMPPPPPGAMPPGGPPPGMEAPPQPPRPLHEYASSWEEYQALKAKAHGGTQHTANDMPDWSGFWRRLGDPGKMDASPIVPYLTPKYRAAYELKRANINKGIEWDRLSWCLPMGMPRWLADPWLHEFTANPKQVWMLYEQMQEERRVFTDGRGHVPDAVAIPLWEGDSIGFWDGDTLVVHTNHMKAGEYWRGSPDTSFQISTVERMRRINDDTIETDLTVYDPVSLTAPIHITYMYKKIKDPTVRMDYDSCEEGNTVYRTPEGGTGYYLPGDPQYHNPTTYGIPEVALDSMPK